MKSKDLRPDQSIACWLISSTAAVEGFTATFILMFPLIKMLEVLGQSPELAVFLQVAVPAIVGVLKQQIAAYACYEYFYTRTEN
ncbi:MAG: hypothetical protein E6R05_00060 [Candidatus Moraniibacteriota bacterium]|nr:MAG: hypothetical protein E6R05_00060 [Candidatus Moranbacteria bacterium]